MRSQRLTRPEIFSIADSIWFLYSIICLCCECRKCSFPSGFVCSFFQTRLTSFQVLNLDVIDRSRHSKIVGCSAYSGEGLLEGFDWLVQDVACWIYVLDWYNCSIDASFVMSVLSIVYSANVIVSIFFHPSIKHRCESFTVKLMPISLKLQIRLCTKSKNFSRFPVGSNLTAHVWSINIDKKLINCIVCL